MTDTLIKATVPLHKRIINDWLCDLDGVDAVRYTINNKRLYFTLLEYDDGKLIQALYTPFYYTAIECFNSGIEVQTLAEYGWARLGDGEELTETIIASVTDATVRT